MKYFEFLKLLGSELSLNPDCILIKVGFPPKELEYIDEYSKVKELGIRDREVILVEEIE